MRLHKIYRLAKPNTVFELRNFYNPKIVMGKNRDLQNGLTLIEILIVMAIFTFISSFGFFFSFDSLQSQRFLSEEKIFMSLLKTVRSRALANINKNPHGIFISENSFILFEGEEFNDESKTNKAFPRDSNIEIQFYNFETEEVVFEKLSGRSSFSGKIILSDGVRTSEINLNGEGRIY